MDASRAKTTSASSTDIASTSETERPATLTASTSSLKRRPRQVGQVSETSARNCISMVSEPSPEQASHRPSATLNEKCPGVSPRASASGSLAEDARARDPRRRCTWPGCRARCARAGPGRRAAARRCPRSRGSPGTRPAPRRRGSRAPAPAPRKSTSSTSVLLPDPLGPVTATTTPSGHVDGDVAEVVRLGPVDGDLAERALARLDLLREQPRGRHCGRRPRPRARRARRRRRAPLRAPRPGRARPRDRTRRARWARARSPAPCCPRRRARASPGPAAGRRSGASPPWARRGRRARPSATCPAPR